MVHQDPISKGYLVYDVLFDGSAVVNSTVRARRPHAVCALTPFVPSPFAPTLLAPTPFAHPRRTRTHFAIAPIRRMRTRAHREWGAGHAGPRLPLCA